MAIPGYDATDVEQFVLEGAGARIAVVADVVPDAFGLERSATDPPSTALSKPINVVGLEGLKAVDAVRIALGYDPSALPPGASPTAVAVGVVTDAGVERLSSAVDLETTTVSATLAERPPGATVVAVADVA